MSNGGKMTANTKRVQGYLIGRCIVSAVYLLIAMLMKVENLPNENSNDIER